MTTSMSTMLFHSVENRKKKRLLMYDSDDALIKSACMTTYQAYSYQVFVFENEYANPLVL